MLSNYENTVKAVINWKQGEKRDSKGRLEKRWLDVIQKDLENLAVHARLEKYCQKSGETEGISEKKKIMN